MFWWQAGELDAQDLGQRRLCLPEISFGEQVFAPSAESESILRMIWGIIAAPSVEDIAKQGFRLGVLAHRLQESRQAAGRAQCEGMGRAMRPKAACHGLTKNRLGLGPPAPGLMHKRKSIKGV